MMVGKGEVSFCLSPPAPVLSDRKKWGFAKGLVVSRVMGVCQRYSSRMQLLLTREIKI